MTIAKPRRSGARSLPLRRLSCAALLAAPGAAAEVLPFRILAALLERRAAQPLASLRCTVLGAACSRTEPFTSRCR